MARESVFRNGLRIKGTLSSGAGDNILTRDASTKDIGEVSGGVTSLAQDHIFVGNASNVPVDVAVTGDITINSTGLVGISSGVIVNDDVNASAAIAVSKLAPLTISRALVSDGSGVISVSATTSTEIGFVSGVTSSIQTQLNAKQATITGAASTVVTSNLTASRAVISNGSGKIDVSAVTNTELGYLSGVTSAVQTQIDGKLSVTLTTPAQGDIIYRNGAGTWVNLAIGSSGQFLTVSGGIPQWGPGVSNGLPTGGTTGQYLRKNTGVDYDTYWDTLQVSDITDVTSTAAELNVLDGITSSTTELNYTTGVTSSIQTQLNNKLDNNLSFHSIFIGGAGNTAQQVAAGTEGSVLTVVSGHPTWQTPPAPGNVSGPVSSTDNAIVRWNLAAGNSIQDSGIIIDDSNNITFPTGTAIQTGTTAGNTLLFRAYDNDSGPAYVTFATLTAGNTPTFDLSDSTTKGGQYIYRAAGTDVSLADGGTGASLADPGADRILFWDDSAGTMEWLTLGTNLSITGTTINASGGGGSQDLSSVLTVGSTLDNSYTIDYVANSFQILSGNFGAEFNGTGGSGNETVSFGVLSGDPGGRFYSDATGAIIKTRNAAPTQGDLYSVGSDGYIDYLNIGTASQLLRVNAGATALEYFTPTFISGNETITLSGEATGSGATSIAVTLSNSAVIGKVLTGFTSGAGTVSGTDTILQAIQKLDGNDGTKWSLASGGTLTGANVITGTTSNTLKGVFNSLGGTITSVTNGAGLWLANTTAAISGSQQVSPSLVFEGQGFATGTGLSTSAKVATALRPIQGTTLGVSLDFMVSTAGGSYTNLLSVTGSGTVCGTYGFTSGANIASLSSTMIFTGQNAASNAFQFTQSSASTTTDVIGIRLSQGFAPPSGTRTWTSVTFDGTINQTGGANGAVTLISAIPTYTSAGGNVTFINYNPTITSISGNHYGIVITPATCLNGFGTTPTAMLHVGAGSTTIAPLKLTSGTNLTTAETGAIEYNGTNLFFTRTGTTRESIWSGNDAASAPATNTIGTIIDYYGTSATRVLTTPNSWASVVIGGTTYKIPLYT